MSASAIGAAQSASIASHLPASGSTTDSTNTKRSSSSPSSSSPIPITVLISGSGTNLQALIDAAESKKLDCQIVRVISNRAKAYGLERAKNANIPTATVSLPKCRSEVLSELANNKAGEPGDEKSAQGQDQDRDQQAATATGPGVAESPSLSEARIKTLARSRFDKVLAETVIMDRPALVVCAGFMHILSASFLHPIEEAGIRVVNLHPALPGEFNGIQAIERAHARWIKGMALRESEGKIGQVEKTGNVDDGGAGDDAGLYDDRHKRTGVMVHRVVLEVDMGEPILTQEIPFVKGQDEDLAVFEDKLHQVEWEVLVKAVGMVLDEIKREKGSE